MDIEKSYEKSMVWIVVSTIILSNVVWIMWLVHDKKLLYDMFNAAVYGLITGWILTDYYRRKDNREKISRSLYGLQKYLLRIKIRLDDLINAGEGQDAHFAEWAILLDKLRETIIDEPYEIFLNLDNSQIKSKETREIRARAVEVINELNNIVLEQDEWPNHTQMILFKSKIILCRQELLECSTKYK